MGQLHRVIREVPAGGPKLGPNQKTDVGPSRIGTHKPIKRWKSWSFKRHSKLFERCYHAWAVASIVHSAALSTQVVCPPCFNTTGARILLPSLMPNVWANKACSPLLCQALFLRTKKISPSKTPTASEAKWMFQIRPPCPTLEVRKNFVTKLGGMSVSSSARNSEACQSQAVRDGRRARVRSEIRSRKARSERALRKKDSERET